MITLASRVHDALVRTSDELLAGRSSGGYWVGELSSSALSTATAVTALSLVRKATSLPSSTHASPLDAGLEWLARHQNEDGGWGDTTQSLSNLSTTALCWAAFGAVQGADDQHRNTVRRAESWLVAKAGGIEPDTLAPAVIARYGKDRTFSVPILTMCALAGRLGSGPEAWKHVIPLPFELAACPPSWFAVLRLPVVSYALPALIAIGQARHVHRPSKNPLARIIRDLTRRRTLRVLERIQPPNGGFLEATPLTSFVTMSLAGSGMADHVVTRLGVNFLIASQRADGSWPIDTNLSTWLTTLSINALAKPETRNPKLETETASWLLKQQYRVVHPYTNAAPGGWAWTDLPGGVPDADDTAGALHALATLRHSVESRGREELLPSVRAGISWLLNLQNSDGGIPTFCRGWGALPFDRSSADITAHAIRAWLAWKGAVPELDSRIEQAVSRATTFLRQQQQTDGSWIPLWFGNQWNPDETNPVYGTARVVTSLACLGGSSMLEGGVHWLVKAQLSDGGWGASNPLQPSVEETALAVEALADSTEVIRDPELRQRAAVGVRRGTDWLLQRIESGSWKEPSPIGFYFARLWYFERLYPVIFTVGALRAVHRAMAAGRLGNTGLV